MRARELPQMKQRAGPGRQGSAGLTDWLNMKSVLAGFEFRPQLRNEIAYCAATDQPRNGDARNHEVNPTGITVKNLNSQKPVRVDSAVTGQRQEG